MKENDNILGNMQKCEIAIKASNISLFPLILLEWQFVVQCASADHTLNGIYYYKNFRRSGSDSCMGRNDFSQVKKMWI